MSHYNTLSIRNSCSATHGSDAGDVASQTLQQQRDAGTVSYADLHRAAYARAAAEQPAAAIAADQQQQQYDGKPAAKQQRQQQQQQQQQDREH
jgi:hypothetical protein